MTSTRGKSISVWVMRAAVVVVALLVTWAIRQQFQVENITPSGDAQTTIRYWEIARTSWSRGEGFPLWDRTQCGGWPFLGNPQAPLLSSFFAGLFRIHGDAMLRWYVTLSMLVGFLGVYAWCRESFGLGRIASLYAGGIFFAGHFITLNLTARPQFTLFALIPWVLYLARRGERDVRAAIFAGCLLALMAIEGASYPVGYAWIALLLLELPSLARRDVSPNAIARMIGVVLLVFLIVGGVKLFPTMVQLLRHPRTAHDVDSLQWTQIIPMLIDSDRTEVLPGMHYHWNEYRAYIGPLAAGMAIAGAGVAVILKPRRLDLAALLLVSLLLMRGRFAEAAPYVLLERVPFFSELAVPSRHLALVSLAMAVCGAIALDTAIAVLRKKWLAAIAVAAAILAVYDPISAGKKATKMLASEPTLPRTEQPPGRYHLVPGADFGRAAEYPARNVGAPNCPKTFEWPEGQGFVLEDKPQAFIDDASAGTVSSIAITQNAYSIDVDLRRPSIVHVNQTFDADWRSSVGDVRRGLRGAIDVQLPAGRQHLDLAYRPRGQWPGIVATFLGLAGIVAWFVLRGRVRKVS